MIDRREFFEPLTIIQKKSLKIVRVGRSLTYALNFFLTWHAKMGDGRAKINTTFLTGKIKKPSMNIIRITPKLKSVKHGVHVRISRKCLKISK